MSRLEKLLLAFGILLLAFAGGAGLVQANQPTWEVKATIPSAGMVYIKLPHPVDIVQDKFGNITYIERTDIPASFAVIEITAIPDWLEENGYSGDEEEKCPNYLNTIWRE